MARGRARRADPQGPRDFLDPLLTSAKFTYVGLAGFGIEITDTETTDG
jgi:hypothetical protein